MPRVLHSNTSLLTMTPVTQPNLMGSFSLTAEPSCVMSWALTAPNSLSGTSTSPSDCWKENTFYTIKSLLKWSIVGRENAFRVGPCLVRTTCVQGVRWNADPIWAAENLKGWTAPHLTVWQWNVIMLQLRHQVDRAVDGRPPQLRPGALVLWCTVGSGMLFINLKNEQQILQWICNRHELQYL